MYDSVMQSFKRPWFPCTDDVEVFQAHSLSPPCPAELGQARTICAGMEFLCREAPGCASPGRHHAAGGAAAGRKLPAPSELPVQALRWDLQKTKHGC